MAHGVRGRGKVSEEIREFIKQEGSKFFLCDTR